MLPGYCCCHSPPTAHGARHGRYLVAGRYARRGMCYCIFHSSSSALHLACPPCSQLPAPCTLAPQACTCTPLPQLEATHPPGPNPPAAAFPPAHLAQSPLKAKSLGSTNRCRLGECCCISRRRGHWHWHWHWHLHLHHTGTDLCLHFWNSGLGPIPDQIRSIDASRTDET